MGPAGPAAGSPGSLSPACGFRYDGGAGFRYDCGVEIDQAGETASLLLGAVVQGSRDGALQNRRLVHAVRHSPLNLGLRRLTAGYRKWPDFIVIGAQRAGTTSLTMWLRTHPQVHATPIRELHYFDFEYAVGPRWYRSKFPIRHDGQLVGESTPYMLFHPLSPVRAVNDLPASTRFIVLLRDPVERAISQYWLNRKRLIETESFQIAIQLESERLAGQEELVLSGQRSDRHQNFSYATRGHYAEQLERWFGHAGRERVLVMQSEELFTSGAAADSVLDWLGLDRFDRPFPRGNEAARREPADADVVAQLHRHFEPYNADLEDLLGRPFWPA